jgi:hypothetical protein
MVFGREISEWVDIYKLLVFRGESPRSLRDLCNWRSPESPQGCVELAFELSEARAQITNHPVGGWVENLLNTGTL